MRERRKNFRVEWNSPAKIYDCNGHFVRLCIVSNFSNSGAKIAGVEPGTVPDEFILRISPHGRAHRCHVIWRSKDGLGVGFLTIQGTPASQHKVSGENRPAKRRRTSLLATV
jgi:hypothetical protein